ncbi:hypothetical protein [Salisediminibacterium halotolerans]|uniref:Uncharacterized protein n=1 Tax=Salisediminibacterium halotolerans TaxID=517425 RepID=A0A1H9U8E6_9BACI|nr:hypothetical protein [Salisediminibacterium haloalkalitolerans]SES05619.1 hypothetical protein SAMN05444126_11323 [Salisediminibacterium haloalkalitolerans]
MNAAFHAIVVSILTGAFAISVLALVIRFYVQLKAKGKIETLGRYADFTAWISALTGFLLIFAAIVTGFAIWPLEAVMNSPILKNKIFTATILLVFWALFLWMRWRYKQRIYESTVLSAYYFLLGLGAFGWGVVTNSIGGDVAGNSSGFEYLMHLFAIDTRWSFYLPNWMLVVIVGLGVIAALLPSFLGKKREDAPKSFQS